jgi:hypothetical protein
MFECKLSIKWGKVKPEELLSLCCYCYKFMREADACLEDSVFTPMMYAFGKKTKPTTFSLLNSDDVPRELYLFLMNEGLIEEKNNE